MRRGRCGMRKRRIWGEFRHQLHVAPVTDADRPKVGGRLLDVNGYGEIDENELSC